MNDLVGYVTMVSFPSTTPMKNLQLGINVIPFRSIMSMKTTLDIRSSDIIARTISLSVSSPIRKYVAETRTCNSSCK